MTIPVHSLNACNSIENAKFTIFIPHMIESYKIPKPPNPEPGPSDTSAMTIDYQQNTIFYLTNYVSLFSYRLTRCEMWTNPWKLISPLTTFNLYHTYFA
jgi:hypothetical protein